MAQEEWPRADPGKETGQSKASKEGMNLAPTESRAAGCSI